MRTALKVESLFTLLFFLASLFPYLPLYGQATEDAKKSIAIVAFEPAMPGEQAIAESVAQRVLKNGKFTLIPVKDSADYVARISSEGDKNVRDSLDGARDLLVKGKESYDRLQFDLAVESLLGSIDGFKKNFQYLKDATDLLKADIYLGMAYITRGDFAEGKKFITDALVMDPERKTRKLSESQFPPNIRAVYQARQDDLARQKAGKIIIVVTPPGGTLYLNGFKMGDVGASHTVSDIPAGKHFVMIEKLGYTRFSSEVDLGQEDVTVNASTERYYPFSPVNPDSVAPQVKDSLVNAASELGSEMLLLGSIDSTGEKSFAAKVQLFDARDGSFSKIEDVNFDNPQKSQKYAQKAVAALLKSSVGVDGSIIPYSLAGFQGITGTQEPDGQPYAPLGGDEEGKKIPIFKKWWFWGIVGGALLCTGGGVLLFSDIAKSDPNYNVIHLNN